MALEKVYQFRRGLTPLSRRDGPLSLSLSLFSPLPPFRRSKGEKLAMATLSSSSLPLASPVASPSAEADADEADGGGGRCCGLPISFLQNSPPARVGPIFNRLGSLR